MIALFSLVGTGWNFVSKADARYAKDKEAKAIHDQLSTDVAMLSQTFLYDQLDRYIEAKRDKIRELNRRLRMKIPRDEEFEIKEDIKAYEQEIIDLQKKQEKLAPLPPK